ncbi:MAG TPA: peptide-methionine (S)-S-oxide reductase MsrA [Rhodocyclaceae bacterium]|uniref:peptide-methionine (S)-S-oxide reductase MsrA n=1 Tax=Zoogloea sp. TaxID=49181 RepID=UPI002D1579B2|nr:peptide-methionine (S)-S-oxide reductase MsrA [Zoogloea sp.]HMV64806.1 peptide-methionine (S)-S-oxide reductase MsrA [Rhodocyclaceae bacterium]HMW53156.1 peptide-methionine (S)-S-oxide reductase MsrA [Rhodocyclaceae bacterium]HMY50304.1 peptide-methionine (S)-S-oxide reductase MsrA [Rhodocyclaceae bacterium]HNA69076.1 peptide-methionine (S)-S-oxide reductase MsrA [Rhodocyclaceae bacterium]HNB64014.1 peptide-methionine (S)-S-oxide reductase MsrA [Rhodocyclaceae bacterium]
MTDTTSETAILAGGCFWCLEAVFLLAEGVHTVTSGYIGGHVDAPTYHQVCDGTTGHAEAIRIEFDPARITFDDLLDIFFAIHDPTTLNRQGNDVGTQYRSAIFATTPAQAAAAQARIAALAGAYHAPIVTEVVPAPVFWPAEPYHHDYFSRNGHQPYCQVIVAPKVQKFLRAFPQRVRST